MRKIEKRKANITSEKETIANIIKLAREQGVEDKAKKIIQKYQDLIKGVHTDAERKQMAVLGMVELHKTIGCVGSLVVDGVEILPEDPSYKEQLNVVKNCVKLD